MYSFLPKALIILTLWSGTGLALTASQYSEVVEQDALGCLSDHAVTAAATPCESYMAAVTAALAAG